VSLLLDTNVVSDLRKKRPDAGVSQWFASMRSSDLHLSVLVIGELRTGIERLARRDKEQAANHEKWLSDLLELFEDRILPVTVEIAEAWGRMTVPDPVPVVDGLLAATALVHDWTLVTRNVTDVQRTGVRLLNPFEA
jgi:toxin FitB